MFFNVFKGANSDAPATTTSEDFDFASIQPPKGVDEAAGFLTGDSIGEVDEDGTSTNQDLCNQLLAEAPAGVGVSYAREALKGSMSDEDIDLLFPASMADKD